MDRWQIQFQWRTGNPVSGFQTGVSLHSHTLHSRESLAFIHKAAASAPILGAAVWLGERRYARTHNTPLDLSRGWWTPPLGPLDAWKLERDQLESLGLAGIVSLTDHDNIEAPVSLQVLSECADVPISLEWTVPFAPTFFHLGVHNLPAASARRVFEELQAWRQTAGPRLLPDLLFQLAAIPGALIVFNHPLWDEDGVGAGLHERAAYEFLGKFHPCIHAVELNGLRPWRENRRVLDFARATGKPLISGGDRHGTEPNAIVNMTHAKTFGEFVEEIRTGYSDVLVLEHYRDNFAMRILHNIAEVLRTYERHAKGWRLWGDRVFYECDDGRIRSLTELFSSYTPTAVRLFLGAVRLASQPGLARLLRDTVANRERVAL